MSDDIKAGDICEIIALGDCSICRRVGGMECQVLKVEGEIQTYRCCDMRPMRLLVYRTFIPAIRSVAFFSREELRKKPPKTKEDAEPRLDHVPAEKEFTEELRRQLSKETV